MTSLQQHSAFTDTAAQLILLMNAIYEAVIDS